MEPGSTGAKGTILLVDDEKSVRDLLRRLLELEGYAVVEAIDAEEALRLFGSSDSELRLVVTDLSLPDLDGWELCRRVRSVQPAMPILVISGSFDLNTLLASNAPDVGFLQKPFAPEDLYRRVSVLLKGPPAP
ncbi:MAG: response regulator [Planctomycetota bacterium]